MCRWCGTKVHWGHDRRGKCDSCRLSDIKEQERNIEECEMNKKMKNELIEKIVAVVMMSDNGEEDRTDYEVCMYV